VDQIKKYDFTGRRIILKSHFLLYVVQQLNLGLLPHCLVSRSQKPTHIIGRTALHEWSACRRGR